MSKTVLFGGIFHETHTFLAESTNLKDFQDMHYSAGPDIISLNRHNGSCASGYLEYAEQQKWKTVPSILMQAMPGGTVEQEVYDDFLKTFLSDLKEHASELDGIYLVLHGAMVSKEIQDVEGSFIQTIDQTCKELGVSIPITGVLDLHCNFTQKMSDHGTCLVSYRKNPHTDAREAAIRAVTFLDELMQSPIDVHNYYRHPALVFPAKGTGTDANPMKAVLAKAVEIEKAHPQIININVFGGYSYADIKDAGFSVHCTTNQKFDQAIDLLNELCDIAKQYKDDGVPLDPPIENVIPLLEEQNGGPVLVIEPSDNIGGGTPGDGTGTLEALLTAGKKGIVAIINDPESVLQCYQKGLGETIDLMVGAKTDAYHGKPLPITGKITNLSDGSFRLEDPKSHLASMIGLQAEMGKCATIENQQVTILLTSLKMPPMDLGQLRSQKISPENAKFIVIKAAVSHKQTYDPIASQSFYVDTPGLGSSNLKSLPYRNIQRPIFPLDEIG